jgi:hypothetical protein
VSGLGIEFSNGDFAMGNSDAVKAKLVEKIAKQIDLEVARIEQ